MVKIPLKILVNIAFQCLDLTLDDLLEDYAYFDESNLMVIAFHLVWFNCKDGTVAASIHGLAQAFRASLSEELK